MIRHFILFRTTFALGPSSLRVHYFCNALQRALYSAMDHLRSSVDSVCSMSQVHRQRLKSDNAVSCFVLSSRLLAHIADSLKRWKPNEKGLLFATRNGTPWDSN
jgi:hypothetical protein